MEKTIFGRDEIGNKCYVAEVIEGYLTIKCWGGTGYATPVEFPEDAHEKLYPILELKEYDIIKYCSENNWFIFDYYNNKIIKEGKIIHEFLKI